MNNSSSARYKIALSAFFIIAIVAYVLWQTMSGAPAAQTLGTTTSAPSETTNPNAGAPQAGGNTPPPTSSGTTALYKNGSYAGAATDAFYGIVQVKAVIQGGRLTDVQFLQYPNDRGHTIEVSQMSMPILIKEAIAAQSAQVDTISGATQTVDGFKASLESALAQARA